MRLKGKVIVITGATKGIGRGIALMSAKEGAKVVVTGRGKDEGAQVVNEIKDKYKTDAIFIEGDITKVETCRYIIQKAEETFGRIDGLVNNAGYFPRATLLETEEDLYDYVFDVNAKSAFFCSKFAIESMIRNNIKGSLVHIGSTHGFQGALDLSAYACAKGAMHTLSKHISKNYSNKGIRSNWITVGWVATDGEVSRLEKEGINMEQIEKMGEEEIPSGRIQTVEDMAYGAIYLLSDESEQVTATDLHITGGFNV